MALPGTKDPVATCRHNMRLVVAQITSRQPTIALCCMPSWASANTSPKLRYWTSTIPLGIGSPAKVGSDFIGKHSNVYFVSISSDWKQKHSIHIDFVASNGGVTTFCQECVIILRGYEIHVISIMSRGNYINIIMYRILTKQLKYTSKPNRK